MHRSLITPASNTKLVSLTSSRLLRKSAHCKQSWQKDRSCLLPPDPCTAVVSLCICSSTTSLMLSSLDPVQTPLLALHQLLRSRILVSKQLGMVYYMCIPDCCISHAVRNPLARRIVPKPPLSGSLSVLMETMSDVTNRYVVRAKCVAVEQYASFRSALIKTMQRPG
jgi:hypothetical protein